MVKPLVQIARSAVEARCRIKGYRQTLRLSQSEINQAVLQGRADAGGYAGVAARGTAIAFGGQITRMVLQLAGTAVMSRLLTPADFGLVAMAATVTAFVGIFTDMGLSAATIQKAQVSQESVSTLFWLNVVVGLILLGLTLLVAPIAGWFYQDARVTPLVMWLGLAMPLAAAAAQHGALLGRAMRWMPIQSIGVISQAIGIVGGIIAIVWFNVGYMALVVQALSGGIANLILHWTFCRWRPSRFRNWRDASSEIRFGANVTGYGVMGFFQRQFDNILIGNHWGATELGFYNRAYNLLSMPILLINNSVGASAVTVLSRIQHDDERWNRAYLVMITGTAFFGTLVCINLFAASQPLILIVLGPQWSEVNRIFEYLAFASIFGCVSNSGGWVFLSKGATKAFFRWGMFAAPLVVLSFVIGLPWKGAGVALSYAVCTGLLMPIYHLYALRQTTIRRATLLLWLLPIFVIAAGCMALGKLTAHALMPVSPALAFFAACAVTTVIYLGLGFACLRIMPHYRPMADDFQEKAAPWLRRMTGQRPA
jgi:polysaccharide transporter, PST family